MMNNTNIAKVLVVEDNVPVSLHIKEIVESRGYSVSSTVMSGEDAIVRVEEDEPDIILMDILLDGELDGIQTAKIINSRHSIPIVYITANTNEDYLDRAQDTMPYGYIIKPINDYELYSTIRTALFKHDFEKRLSISENRYHSLFSFMSDAFVFARIMYNKKGIPNNAVILEANRAFALLVGKSDKEIENVTVTDLFPDIGTAVPYWSDIIARVVKDRRPVKMKVTIKYINRWFNITAYTPQRDCIGVVIDDVSENVEAENRLKVSEEKFRMISLSAQDAIIMIDNNGRVTYWNPHSENIFGYTSDEILGRNLHEMIAPIHLMKVHRDNFNAWRSTGKGEAIGKTMELPAITKDGREIIVELSLSSVQVQERWNAIGIIRDITRRKTLENDLREKEQHFRKLLECIQTCIVVIDSRDFRIIDCNTAAEEMLMKHKEDIINRYCFDIFCVADKGICPIHGMNSLYNFETEIKRIDDREKIPVIKNMIKTEINGRECFIESFVDISIQKQTEDELKRAHREIANLLSSIDSLLIGVSTKDVITHWNSVAENLFGIKSEDAIGKQIITMNLMWEWDEICYSIGQCLTEDQSIQLNNIRFKDVDGKPRILGITINPIYNPDGSVNGFLIYGKDITEKKIMEIQLLQDQKLKSIGELAAGIAHEINTPAQYVNNNTHFLKEAFRDICRIYDKVEMLVAGNGNGGDVGPMIGDIISEMNEIDAPYLIEEIPKAIDQSLEGLDRISTIVKSMKSFSHPGQDKVVSLDINKAIEDTLVISRNEWKYNSRVITHFDQSNPEVYCYPAELNQVFLNIIVNASHAISEAKNAGLIDEGVIEISTSKNDDRVEISIKDNGTGIPESIRDRIFDPFFTTKEVGKGTGQGLAIVHSIVVQKYEGLIIVDSEEGKGAVFRILLPSSMQKVVSYE